MPNGQGGAEWVDGESFMELYDRYGITLTGAEIRQRREAVYARALIERDHYTLQPGETVHVESGTYMAGRSFTVTENALHWNAMSDELWFSSPPKPKRSTRPVSAIFYPMVNECGY